MYLFTFYKRIFIHNVHALISMRKIIKKKIIIANYISYHLLHEKLG